MGGAPGAGYETEMQGPEATEGLGERANARIESARHEFQSLLDLTRQMGDGLSREEIFSLSAAVLHELVPHDTLAFYACRDEVLIPEHVTGEECRLFSSLRIPVGQGISGWVLEKRKAILNGDPAVESHYLQDAWKADSLRAALSIPLPGPTGMVGVLTLCHREPDHFTWEELHILLSVNWLIGHIFHQALRLDGANTTLTDRELPPRRLLSRFLERELNRCRRTQAPLAVLVFHLQGWEEVRDREGHLMAERILQAALQALRRHCREYDYAGRTEENGLVMVLPGLSRQGTRTRLPELQAAALGAVVKICDAGGLLVQGGAAVFPDDAEDADTLVERAERQIVRVAQKRREREPRVANGTIPVITRMMQ